MLDLFTAELSRLTNNDLYSAIAAFARAQPGESYRHDFKESWNNEALKDIAGFANTFGGILIVGVRKNQKDVEAKLVGHVSGSELSTAIASAVATNISPTPSFDVYECYEPGDTNKRFCVIRVSSDSSIHVVTKKDISNRVLVRNVDQTIPADGAQLRMMIDREKHSATSNNDALFHHRGQNLLNAMPIGQGYGSPAVWPSGDAQRSRTYFKLALIPREGRVTRLDRRSEKQFKASICQNYRRVRELDGAGAFAESVENRTADYYELQWYQSNIDYVCRWRITNSLEIGQATQIKVHEGWSLLDLVAYTVLMLRMSANWWGSQQYFGGGLLHAELNVDGLTLQRGKSGEFTGLFSPGRGDFGLAPEVLDVGRQLFVQAFTYTPINFAEMRTAVPDIVTSVMNALLRPLGLGIFWDEFRESVTVIARGME